MTRFVFKDNSTIISETDFERTAERVIQYNPFTSFFLVRTGDGKEKCINLDWVKYFDEVKESEVF